MKEQKSSRNYLFLLYSRKKIDEESMRLSSCQVRVLIQVLRYMYVIVFSTWNYISIKARNILKYRIKNYYNVYFIYYIYKFLYAKLINLRIWASCPRALIWKIEVDESDFYKLQSNRIKSGTIQYFKTNRIKFSWIYIKS